MSDLADKTHMDTCDLACGKRMKGWNINIITKVITYSRPKLVSDVIIQQGHRLFSPPFSFLDFMVDDKVLFG